MSRLRCLRFLALSACALAVAIASADIRYKVTPHSDKQTLTVEMDLPRTKFDTDFQIPNWGPGGYLLSNHWKGVKDLHILDGAGNELTVSKPNDFTWRVSTATGDKLTVRYEVSCSYADGAMHYGGPATYMYVVDRKGEPCILDLEVPPSWRIAIGLEHRHQSDHIFKVKNYDVLADNPVTMGDFLEVHYSVAGKDHTLALRGAAKSDVDMQELVKTASFISKMETDFFGGAPYDKYVWHFNIADRPDGSGGLEHLSSTEIQLASGVGPRCTRVMAHEFFHLWNVKRIRSSVLGPFDYTQLPKTGALWWLEGVTDYYSHFLLHRYGWSSDKAFYEDVTRNVESVRQNKGRFEISPYDASFRVGEANGGVGNSRGLKISYYDTGWLLGMILDIEIRSKSNGKYSLDDVVYALWQECRNDRPGFREDEIRNLCMRYGGPSLGDFYDKWVLQPGELPVEDQLAKVGLKLTEKQVASPSLGFTWEAARSYGGAKVGGVTDKTSPVKSGDVITEVDGKPLRDLPAGQIQKIMLAAQEGSTPGTPIHVKIDRKGEGDNVLNLDADVKPLISTKTVRVVEEDPGASGAQVKLRDGWFWGSLKRGSIATAKVG